jgi:hypothetical protein
MGRARGNPEQVKSNKRSRDKRYLANQAVMERKRERDKLYQRNKQEQARLRLHADPLAQLADVATQRRYLREASGVPADSEPIMEEEEEREPIVDVGIAVEEDGEILEGFVGPRDGEWNDGVFDDGGGFPDEPESDVDGGGGLDGRFPDEPESDTNSDTDDEFPDEPETHDEGS